MTLFWLVRHAKAEERSPGGDAARRLTDDGRSRFEALVAALGGRLAPTRVLASPFARARETAEIVGSAAGAPVEDEDALTSGRSTGAELLALARRAGGGCALVGHNPELAEAIAIAAGHGVAVPPGTIAAVALEDDRARLVWLEVPERAG